MPAAEELEQALSVFARFLFYEAPFPQFLAPAYIRVKRTRNSVTVRIFVKSDKSELC